MRTARRTAESCETVDVNQWNREGWLKPGQYFTATWTDAWGGQSSTGVIVQREEIVLAYTTDGKEVRTVVRMQRTPCHYGGARPWLQCPKCNRRVSKLYLASGVFCCRHCHNLTYASCLDSHKWDSTISKHARHVERIRRRLGAKGNETGLLVRFHPSKPKWMHWETYWKLSVQMYEEEQAAFGRLRSAFNVRNLER